jgi:hypothetical protein
VLVEQCRVAVQAAARQHLGGVSMIVQQLRVDERGPAMVAALGDTLPLSND